MDNFNEKSLNDIEMIVSNAVKEKNRDIVEALNQVKQSIDNLTKAIGNNKASAEKNLSIDDNDKEILEFDKQIINNINKSINQSEKWILLEDAKMISGTLKFRNVESFMKEHNVTSFNKARFIGLINQGLIPIQPKTVKNQSYYTNEHILWYILIDELKIIPSEKIKEFINILNPILSVCKIEILLQEYYETGILISDLIESSMPMIIDILDKKFSCSNDGVGSNIYEYIINLFVTAIKIWSVNKFNKTIGDYIDKYNKSNEVLTDIKDGLEKYKRKESEKFENILDIEMKEQFLIMIKRYLKENDIKLIKEYFNTHTLLQIQDEEAPFKILNIEENIREELNNNTEKLFEYFDECLNSEIQDDIDCIVKNIRKANKVVFDISGYEEKVY